ncbi:hypothetical protein HYD70_00855 [Mycoplasmopsis bovis]|nr:hypothetical protein [Mycoplasmopsis bovis]QQH49695.1 hypothetical protein HYD70_00855 [Mycoplasmopsis bovis]
MKLLTNYDFIDPATGTKNEILWISNDNLNKHGLDDKYFNIFIALWH